MADIEFDPVAFERALRQELVEHVRAAMVRIAPVVKAGVQDAVEASVRSSPEYESLLGGDLQRLFGISDPQAALNNIVAAMRHSVVVSLNPPSGEGLGGLKVEILRDDMGEILGVDGGGYMSYSVTRNTQIWVPWLEWLVTAGDRVVISDFEVKTDRGGFTGTRTGQAVMVSPRRRASRGFRVPPEFSGTADANWLTRCLEQAAGPIIEVFQRAVEGI